MSDDPSFTIRDRRHSADDADRVNDRTDDWADDRVDDRADASAPGAGPALPAVDFSTFLLSLGTSALVHLGEAPTPEDQLQRNLPLAQQVIDILALISTKTRGNLDADEAKLLEELLYDLRLRYVNAAR
ncbi:MAG: DUF1844 domain-containing protein [Proteobacteria bacterium]|nr:DUF1844 domain-containing protein [Pseudomonadota bacterium]